MAQMSVPSFLKFELYAGLIKVAMVLYGVSFLTPPQVRIGTLKKLPVPLVRRTRYILLCHAEVMAGMCFSRQFGAVRGTACGAARGAKTTRVSTPELHQKKLLRLNTQSATTLIIPNPSSTAQWPPLAHHTPNLMGLEA